MFGAAIDYGKVRIRRRKWFPFHLRKYVMAPLGHLHFHPESKVYCDDFSTARLDQQALFIHEMTHVWQHQKGLFLPLRRFLYSPYSYCLKPGRKLEGYGIEQQAEIVSHAFLLRKGRRAARRSRGRLRRAGRFRGGRSLSGGSPPGIRRHNGRCGTVLPSFLIRAPPTAPAAAPIAAASPMPLPVTAPTPAPTAAPASAPSPV